MIKFSAKQAANAAVNAANAANDTYKQAANKADNHWGSTVSDLGDITSSTGVSAGLLTGNLPVAVVSGALGGIASIIGRFASGKAQATARKASEKAQSAINLANLAQDKFANQQNASLYNVSGSNLARKGEQRVVEHVNPSDVPSIGEN